MEVKKVKVLVLSSFYFEAEAPSFLHWRLEKIKFSFLMGIINGELCCIPDPLPDFFTLKNIFKVKNLGEAIIRFYSQYFPPEVSWDESRKLLPHLTIREYIEDEVRCSRFFLEENKYHSPAENELIIFYHPGLGARWRDRKEHPCAKKMWSKDEIVDALLKSVNKD